jgi:hypothetical protein
VFPHEGRMTVPTVHPAGYTHLAIWDSMLCWWASTRAKDLHFAGAVRGGFNPSLRRDVQDNQGLSHLTWQSAVNRSLIEERLVPKCRHGGRNPAGTAPQELPDARAFLGTNLVSLPTDGLRPALQFANKRRGCTIGQLSKPRKKFQLTG